MCLRGQFWSNIELWNSIVVSVSNLTQAFDVKVNRRSSTWTYDDNDWRGSLVVVISDDDRRWWLTMVTYGNV